MAGKKGETFTADERAAMRDRARELKRGGKDGERDVLAKIAELAGSDRELAERVHAIVRKAAPDLAPRTWYGMPAYADAEGKVVVFFQAAAKFTSRYATLGFSDRANLDAGSMWPTSFALTTLTAAGEKEIAKLVRRAVA